MLKMVMFIIVSFFVLLTACAKNEYANISVAPLPNEINNNEEQKQVVDVYQKFLKEFKKEDLGKKGIDIEKIVKGYFSDVTGVEEIDYQIEWINLSRIDNFYKGDLLLNININNNLCESSTIVCLFVFQENGQFINTLTELHNYANVSVVDILGNDRKQIVLITDDSGNGYTLQLVKILSFNPTSQKVEIVFDEILRGNAFLSYKETTESEFYNISFENEYEFVSKDNGKKDILFTSRIFENEEETLETGSTRFTFDGVKFVPINYYDYRTIAKQIYDSKS